MYYIVKFFIAMATVRNPKIFTGILFLPALGFFVPNEQILNHGHFLVILLLIVLSYCSYAFNFQSKSLNFLRKCLGCLSTAMLALFLSAEVSDILVSVYNVSFGEELTFMIKMIVMLSNMEGNLDLCLEKEASKPKDLQMESQHGAI